MNVEVENAIDSLLKKYRIEAGGLKEFIPGCFLTEENKFIPLQPWRYNRKFT
jgi:hypothetical protein